MNAVQAAEITTADTEECPLTILIEQMKGIQDSIDDLIVYAQGQIDEATKDE